MVTKSGKTFVYGQFTWLGSRPLLPPPPGWYEIAIELLREYSATEFIGKLYGRSGGDWIPIDPSRVTTYEWYKFFSRTKRLVFFEMAGSGNWEVLHFRNESDENGPYVAVALRYYPKTLGWQEPKVKAER